MPRISESSPTEKSMKVLQLNLNHCEAAQSLLTQTVYELGIDVAILSEQYKNRHEASWASNANGKCAIWSCGSNPTHLGKPVATTGYVRAKINNLHIYSCYIPPSTDLCTFSSIMDELVNDAKQRSTALIAGDFNAWAAEWGCKRTNPKGRELLNALAALDLVLLNSGTENTFSKNGTGSIIDLSFVSRGLSRATRWYMSDHYTHSDHRAIVIAIEKAQVGTIPYKRQKGWNTRSFDEKLFEIAFDDTEVTLTVETAALGIRSAITKACDTAMVRQGRRQTRKPAYWWNDEIAELRAQCNRARRLCQRSRNATNSVELRLNYKTKRKAFKLAIRDSKRSMFKELCDDVNNNPWGSAYKIVRNKMKQTVQPTCPTLLDQIVRELFPSQPDFVRTPSSEPATNIPAVNADEVLKLSSKLTPRKAPGPDGIPNIALKKAVSQNPCLFARVFNMYLQEGVFPNIWKLQKLVLVPKKPGACSPNEYRPLCMLDSIGKLFELVIKNRLETYVDGQLSSYQFGFRRKRSTTDAIEAVKVIAEKAIEGKRWLGGAKEYCLVVTLDVKNAFNSARWIDILHALRVMKVPTYLQHIISSYLSNRVLRYDSDAGIVDYKVTGGVPQGSVLGPLLWNIMYDGILWLKVHKRASFVGFADDISIVVTAKTLAEIVNIAQQAIGAAQRWLGANGLKLATHKTEAVLISSRKRVEKVKIRVGDSIIESKPYIKYLGVLIDHRINFRDHMEYASNKAAIATAALARIMANIGGPRQQARQVLAGVVRSILLYGATVWREAFQHASYVRSSNSAYRLCALRVCSAFRTVSEDAALIIAGLCPLDLIAQEMHEMRRLRNNEAQCDQPALRKAINQRCINQWQTRWDSANKGRWTHRLIPNIESWLQRKHGEVGFYLCQILSGHGCFKAYLHRFGHEQSPYCEQCTPAVEEDAEHVLFTCPRFRRVRAKLEDSLGSSITAENLVPLMLKSEDSWNKAQHMAAEIMQQLRHSEQARRMYERRIRT